MKIINFSLANWITAEFPACRTIKANKCVCVDAYSGMFGRVRLLPTTPSSASASIWQRSQKINQIFSLFLVYSNWKATVAVRLRPLCDFKIPATSVDEIETERQTDGYLWRRLHYAYDMLPIKMLWAKMKSDKETSNKSGLCWLGYNSILFGVRQLGPE